MVAEHADESRGRYACGVSPALRQQSKLRRVAVFSVLAPQGQRGASDRGRPAPGRLPPPCPPSARAPALPPLRPRAAAAECRSGSLGFLGKKARRERDGALFDDLKSQRVGAAA